MITSICLVIAQVAVLVALYFNLNQSGRFDPAAIAIFCALTVLTILFSWQLATLTSRCVRRAQSFSASILEVLSDAVIVIDEHGLLTRCNSAAEQMFGYARDEVLGQSVNRLLVEPPAEFADTCETATPGGYLDRYLRAGQRRVLGDGHIVTAVRNSGETFPARLLVKALKIDGERFFVGIVTDFSERYAAERKICQLAMAMEASADAIYITDTSGKIEFANPAFTALTGWTAEEIRGRYAHTLDSAAMPITTRQAMQTTLDRGQAWRGRVLAQRKPGVVGADGAETLWMGTTIAPIRDGSNSVVGYVSIQQDVTHQVHLEYIKALAREAADLRVRVAEILHAQQPLHDKLSAVLDLLVATRSLNLQEKGGIFLRSDNGAELRIYVLHGAFTRDVIDTDRSIPWGTCLCGRAAATGEVLISDDCFGDARHEHWYADMQPHGHYIVPLMHADGALGVMFLYTERSPSRAPLRVETLRLVGDMIGLAIANDRLQRQLCQARDAALDAARVKSQFLANVSHEIRTPMNGVIGMLDLLRDTLLGRQQIEFVDTACNAATALLDILNDLLDYSKLEAGKLEIESIDFDLQQLVEDLGTMFAARATKRGLELACYVAPSVPMVCKGDPTRVRQVLANLLSNAVKFTEHGEVVLRVTARRRSLGPVRVRFEVRDTGIGISAEAQATLFQSFVQADGSTTRRFGGTGLGLAISKQLVELMGGEIEVVSRPGHGSIFRFWLHLKPGNNATNGGKHSAAWQDARVLVVDDNTTSRKILRHYLRAWHISHDSTAHGAMALDLLRRAALAGRPFEVAIIDLAMLELNGLELAQRIKGDSQLSVTKVVMLSSMGVATEEIKRIGVELMLLKPVRQSALFNALVRLLDQTYESPATTTPASWCDATRFRGRTLVVENNALNQIVVRWLLGRFGLVPELADNGIEALERVETGHYDLVFMDCQMVDMDGYEATREIRRREHASHRPRLPIVAMTAGAMTDDRDACFAAGMDDYLTKPLTRESLLAVLQRWLPAEGAPSPTVEHHSAEPMAGGADEVIDAEVLQNLKTIM